MHRRQFLAHTTTIGLSGLVVSSLAASAEMDGGVRPSQRINIQPVIEAAQRAVKSSGLSPGVHRRWLGAKEKTQPDGRDPNPYGCADAVNILYTLGHFPRLSEERDAFVEGLLSFQKEDGLFQEATHHPFHVTAHCVAALELFDAGAASPLTGLHRYSAPEALEVFLDQLDWVADPWNASHQGAGLYAALVVAREVSPDWEERYFNWLAAEQDPTTGFWRRGAVATAGTTAGRPLFHHLASSFHYLFNHEYARRPLAYPAAMVDTCLELWRSGEHPLGKGVGFAEIDWVYCLTRSWRQCGHRSDEVQKALVEFATGYAEMLLTRVERMAVPFDDLHRLFGATCCLAEVQTWLPGLYRSDRPLKLVLDRRPFI